MESVKNLNPIRERINPLAYQTTSPLFDDNAQRRCSHLQNCQYIFTNVATDGACFTYALAIGLIKKANSTLLMKVVAGYKDHEKGYIPTLDKKQHFKCVMEVLPKLTNPPQVKQRNFFLQDGAFVFHFSMILKYIVHIEASKFPYLGNVKDIAPLEYENDRYTDIQCIAIVNAIFQSVIKVVAIDITHDHQCQSHQCFVLESDCKGNLNNSVCAIKSIPPAHFHLVKIGEHILLATNNQNKSFIDAFAMTIANENEPATNVVPTSKSALQDRNAIENDPDPKRPPSWWWYLLLVIPVSFVILLAKKMIGSIRRNR